MNRNEEKQLENLSPFEIKNTLIELASHSQKSMVNAGRGNPNWVATEPRSAFFQLGLFALQEANTSFQQYDGFGGIGSEDNISGRFLRYCEDNEQAEGIAFLLNAYNYLTCLQQFNGDELIYEWVSGILGDNYPVPDRMLKYSEKIARKYLEQEMCHGPALPESPMDLFAVEGGTAAMVYIFNTLKSNRLLNSGDNIAIGAPIFTPYIEMPELEDYNLNKIEIMATEEAAWQIPDAELEKLYDPSIKAFFLVNPSNPGSVKLSDKTLYKIADIAKQRPELIILTDDVYGTFADNFTSLAMIAPRNTILVYSYSKYFGATGWRLGVIGLSEDNILDRMIADLPEDVRAQLTKRYSGISLDPANLKFIDRLVADSRAVALNHTAGLSTPQQIQMAMFSLASLLEEGEQYQKDAKQIVRNRYNALMKESKKEPIVNGFNMDGAFYYAEIDVKDIIETAYEAPFFEWMENQFEPLDFIVRLASEYGIVVMPGAGFDAPNWSLRVSLANLEDEQYELISTAINKMFDEYYQEYLAAKA